ncbi:N-acetylmuramoyl-L-alanine amidase [Membranihabitans marinus]|uniref:N-acetylmuramoyl-L-alanine amidase n=1 Tax=Membranihabitans marinus TaxID=1227546 RepID=UPI001F41D600|nr:N-acetylmuramoyl-L-alanine amidase [Membranihabitans marinus]
MFVTITSSRLKTFFLTLLSFCLFTNVSFSFSKDMNPTDFKNNANKIKKVVLDAGHGGKDPGAIGKRSKEKEIALSLVLKLGKAINSKYPDIEVIYTRKTDEFIPLYERAKIANTSNADLFISIHCNSVNNNTAYGSETFVMGLAKNESNLEVAKRENGSILFEENYKQNYDGFDPSSEASHIILNMFQNAYLDRSLDLANIIETNLVTKNKRKSRGVKQAGFIVLKNTFMPSVLFEAGFLSNQKEEAYLLSDKGQNQIVASLVGAIGDYKDHVENEGENVVETPQIVEVEKPAVVVTKSTPTNNTSSANVNKTTTVTQTSMVTTASQSNYKGIEFCVQLAATPRKENIKNTKWRNIENLSIRYENNMYKYQVTAIPSYSKASDIKNSLKARGFDGAFIVAYSNGNRINITDAVAMSH